MSIKSFIVWIVLVFVSFAQLLFYLPSFTCTPANKLPLCTPQFTFALVDDSPLGRELLSSIREFTKLLSYLTIDMGWSSSTSVENTRDMYNEENLVDTFNPGVRFSVNYEGYCKYNISGDKVGCYGNGVFGMDVITVLFRDIGIQLGHMSSLHVNDTVSLGNSVVYTYKLASNSLYNFLKNDRKEDNMFARIVLGRNNDNDNNYDIEEKSEPEDNAMEQEEIDEGGGGGANNFAKIVILSHWFLLFNRMTRIVLYVEVSIGAICLGLDLLSLAYFIPPVRLLIRTIGLTLGTIYILLATYSFASSIILFVVLNSLKPEVKAPAASYDDWGLLRVTIGTGLVLGMVRYVIQVMYFTLLVIFQRGHRQHQPQPAPSEAQQQPSGDSYTTICLHRDPHSGNWTPQRAYRGPFQDSLPPMPSSASIKRFDDFLNV